MKKHIQLYIPVAISPYGNHNFQPVNHMNITVNQSGPLKSPFPYGNSTSLSANHQIQWTIVPRSATAEKAVR